VRVSSPPAALALAAKLAARVEGDIQALDDLRFVLRILDLASAEGALAAAVPYIAERYLPADTRPTLEALLGR
jgi:hypothetical protein